MSSARRIIVGASGSPGSLLALRYAQHLACDLDATLVPVLSWLPPDGDLADRRTPCREVQKPRPGLGLMSWLRPNVPVASPPPFT